MDKRALKLLGCVVFVLMISAQPSLGQTLSTISRLSNSTSGNGPGSNPDGKLLVSADGSIFGTTSLYGPEGSNNSGGTIFKIPPGGTLATIYNFCFQQNCTDGSQPVGGLILGSDGNLYGTTFQGGQYGKGEVFRISPLSTPGNANIAVLYSFCSTNAVPCSDGASPVRGLVQGSDGNFYGLTEVGGSGTGYMQGSGTIFQMQPAGGHLAWTYTFCKSAGCSDGQFPYGTLVEGANGNFYGTTYGGGSNSAGTIFMITPAGVLTTIYNFCSEVGCSDGSYPESGLTLGADGNLYGLTAYGGFYSSGTAFKISPLSGHFETVYSFCTNADCSDGSFPVNDLIQGHDGNFYGTTEYGGLNNNGTLFSITPEGIEKAVYVLCAPASGQPFCASGSDPESSLVQTSNGDLYGSTYSGGDATGDGTIFKLALGRPALAAKGAQADYFGTGRSDLTVWRPSTGNWYILNFMVKPPQESAVQWGMSTDIPVLGDYDGDGKSDESIWRPSTGTFYVRQSRSGQSLVQQLGTTGDVPVPGDYDGDGKSDFAVWRPSNGSWYVILSNGGQSVTQQLGEQGDIPVPGDYDGDGKTDMAVWRPSNGSWYILLSSTNQLVVSAWGAIGDQPVPGDYDGDGKTDIAVWRPSSGTWYAIQSSNSQVLTRQWGQSGDIPVPRDYDGDGKTDIAIWRPANGTWYLNLSNAFEDSAQEVSTPLGVSTDVPVNASVGQYPP